MSTPSLAAPIRMGALALRNRIVLAPMTRSRAGDDGVPTPSMTEYYLQRSSAGLLITEGVNISPLAKGNTRTPGIWLQAHIDAWSTVTSPVHRMGGTIVLQLWHTGRLSHSLVSGHTPVAPSSIAAPGEKRWGGTFIPFEAPRSLDAWEIAATISDYARAARHAIAAGFDGVEIHAANGYLPDQFLHAGSNTRTDAYGGAVAHRRRFLIEVVDAVAAEVGSDRAGVRLSPSSTFGGMSDPDPEALYSALLEDLQRRTLAYLHVVEPGIAGADNAPSNVDLGAAWVRSRWAGSLISTGGYDGGAARIALAEGHADAIGFGRAYIGTPDLAERLISGREVNWAPRECYYRSGDAGYIDFPSDRARELASAVIAGHADERDLATLADDPAGWEARLALTLVTSSRTETGSRRPQHP